MKTRYFLNSDAHVINALKRDNGDGTTSSFSTNSAVWTASAYTGKELRTEKKFVPLTRDEARKAYPKAFRKAKVTVVAAIPGEVVNDKPGIEMANKYRTAVQGLDYKGGQKIAAIKEVRCLGEFGLAESLTIVEHFDAFLSFIEQHNELPNVGNRWDNHPFTKKA